MYLRTPKRYTAKGSKRPLISLRWLWLYLLAPIVIVAAALAWNFRTDLSERIAIEANKVPIPRPFSPTPTATLPPTDLIARINQTLESGSINDALDAMRAYSDAVPNETKWHAALAQTLIMRAHKDSALVNRAVQAGQAAINANPEAVEGWVSYALVLDWADQSKQALSYALRAKDIGDSTGMNSAVLAGIYFTLGDTKQASTLADEAIKLNPKLAYAYYVKGQIAQQGLGNAKEGMNYYEQAWSAAKADPTQWGGYIAAQLAPLYSANNQPDKAINLLTAAVQRDKDDPVLQNQLAQVHYRNGDYVKAGEAAQRCIDIDRDYAPCHVWLMRLAYNDKQWERAAQSAQRAIDLGSQETAPFYIGGVSYINLNRCPDAVKLLNGGLAIAERLKDDSRKRDFVDALRECGVVNDNTPLTTPEPTIAATATVKGPAAKPTVTPKKK